MRVMAAGMHDARFNAFGRLGTHFRREGQPGLTEAALLGLAQRFPAMVATGEQLIDGRHSGAREG